jgi:hypothetical protein
MKDIDFNHSMNSNEDAVLADAIFGKCSDDLAKQTSGGARKEPSVSGDPAGKSVEMPTHGAEKAADPAHAMDSDGQEPSDTAVEKYSDSLQNLADLSNAAEFAEHDKDHHGATSTHVQQQVSPPQNVAILFTCSFYSPMSIL